MTKRNPFCAALLAALVMAVCGAALPTRADEETAAVPDQLAAQPAEQQDQQPSSTGQQGQQPSSNQQQGQQPDQSQQPPAQPSSQQSNGTPPAQSSSAPQNTQPGMTEKEKENVEHEKKTGTSKDRMFWIMPNFMSIEDVDTLPRLTAGQKFKAVGRGLVDPFEFFIIGIAAGLDQATNSNPTYGQGAQGYGKRYATDYADNAVENFMTGAVLPSVLRQDPRYYELGHGGFVRRTQHAISRLFITRTDSGGTQFNYSEVMGAGVAASISTYTYHPVGSRSVGTVFNVWGTQMGWDLATYMLKEFWPDLRRRVEHKRAAAPDAQGQ